MLPHNGMSVANVQPLNQPGSSNAVCTHIGTAPNCWCMMLPAHSCRIVWLKVRSTPCGVHLLPGRAPWRSRYSVTLPAWQAGHSERVSLV